MDVSKTLARAPRSETAAAKQQLLNDLEMLQWRRAKWRHLPVAQAANPDMIQAAIAMDKAIVHLGRAIAACESEAA